jgi:tetratricopeptide (TPR) repeat protein
VFDLRLLLADVADRPSREDATRKAFEELAAQNPNRAEVYIALAYLDWRQKRSSDALEHFAKAFELGSRNPRMLWDYGRMTESADAAKSIEALRELLRLEPERLDVRLELASMQLRSHAPKEALQSLVPVKKVTPEDAPRVLTLLAYANLEAGDRVMARNAAEQLKKVSTTIEERSQADRILQFIEAARSNTAKPVLAFEESDDLPGLNRRDAAPEALRPVVRRPSLTGKFVDLECEEHAKVVIETAEGKKFFLIEDPSKLLVNGKSGETMDLSCGPQKPVQIRIEYDPPGLNRPGIDGVVRVIRFDQ